MKLTASQKKSLEEIKTSSYYWCKAILGEDVKLVKGKTYHTKKFMVGSVAVFQIWCNGFGKEYHLGSRGKLTVRNL